MNDLFAGLTALTLGDMPGQLMPLVAPRFAEDDSLLLDDPFVSMLQPALFDFTLPEGATRSLRPVPVSPREWTRMAVLSPAIQAHKSFSGPPDRRTISVEATRRTEADRQFNPIDDAAKPALVRAESPAPEHFTDIPPPLIPRESPGRIDAHPESQIETPETAQNTKATEAHPPTIPPPLIQPVETTGPTKDLPTIELHPEQREAAPQKQPRELNAQAQTKSVPGAPQRQITPGIPAPERIDRRATLLPPPLVAQRGQQDPTRSISQHHPEPEQASEDTFTSGLIDEERHLTEAVIEEKRDNRPLARLPDRITFESAALKNSVNTDPTWQKPVTEKHEKTLQTERQAETKAESASEPQQLGDQRPLPPPLVPDAIGDTPPTEQSAASSGDIYGHTPAAPQPNRQERQEPAIEIRIGLVEVRASRPQPQQPTSAPRPAPALSLGDYLRRRRDGR